MNSTIIRSLPCALLFSFLMPYAVFAQTRIEPAPKVFSDTLEYPASSSFLNEIRIVKPKQGNFAEEEKEISPISTNANLFESNSDCVGCVPSLDSCCVESIWDRSYLTGDMGGARSRLTEHGIVVDIQSTQFYQGVTSGGNEQKFQFGGKNDYMFTFLGGKLGLNEGFTIIMHAETRFGEDINAASGAFSIANTSMLYPLPGSHETAITGLIAMQALSETVAVAAGKFNNVDLWNMLYPHTGRGVEGFMNLNAFSLSLPWLRWVNPAFMGAGVMAMNGPQIRGAVLVFDTQNVTTTSGFKDLFDEGTCVLGLWRFFTNYGCLPGSHTFIGGWSSRSYTSLDRTDWTFIPGQGLVAQQVDDPWSLAYFFDQVLWADPCNEHRNLRLFTGWSLSDGNPSFGRWGGFVSLEGTGLSDCRPNDRMGASYFYNQLSSDFSRLVQPVVDIEEQQGVELYYNREVTPWFHLTLDLQVIDTPNSARDTAVVLGLRSNIRF